MIEKGYTLTVKSWENDYDNLLELSKTYDTKEEALAIKDIVMQCKKNTGLNLGNTMAEDYADYDEDILKFMSKYKDYDFFKKYDVSEDDEIIDTFVDILHDLIGASEWYFCRVTESAVITYSDSDIMCEIIE
jgi:hypothetical protein